MAGWILPALAYGFVARALTGPKLSPLAFVATRVVTPRLPFTHRYSPGPAKRPAPRVFRLSSCPAMRRVFPSPNGSM